MASEISYMTVNSPLKLLCIINKAVTEMKVFDAEDNFKVLYSIAHSLYSYAWDTVFRSEVLQLSIITKDLLMVYSGDHSFRIIDFSLVVSMNAPYMKSKFVKFEFSPSTEDEMNQVHFKKIVLPLVLSNSELSPTGEPEKLNLKIFHIDGQAYQINYYRFTNSFVLGNATKCWDEFHDYN